MRDRRTGVGVNAVVARLSSGNVGGGGRLSRENAGGKALGVNAGGQAR